MATYNSSSIYPNRFARKSTARRASGIAKKRYINKPVARLLKADRKPRAPPVKNASAITLLSKQVKSLQLGQYGSKQHQMQHVELSSDTATTLPTQTTPLAFMFNSFYNQTKILQGSIVASNPVVTDVASFNKQTFDVDIDNAFQWNEFENQDLVSTTEYLPVYSKLKITFAGKILSTRTAPVRFRVTLFKLKNQPMVTSAKNFNMPYGLGAYWHMCQDDVTKKNYFSKKYHTVLMDKWLTIVPPTPHLTSQVVYRTLELPYSFGSLKPVTFDKQALPATQTVYTNIPQEDVIWCLFHLIKQATAE